MFRRLFLLPVFFLLVFLIFPKGVAAADGSLIVKLNPDQGDKVKITAVRSESPDFNTSIQLTYNAALKQWESGSISHTDPGVGGCSQKRLLFDINVTSKSGEPLGGAKRVVVCGETVAKTINVTSVNDAKNFGGIAGRLLTNIPNLGAQPCGPNSQVNISGPTDKPNIELGDDGSFNTGRALKSGKYIISGTCVHKGLTETKKNFRIANITVSSKQGITQLGDRIVDNSPADRPEEAAADTIDCDPGAFSWLICPVIQFAQETVDFFKNSILIPFLETSPVKAEGPLYESWKGIRTLANVLLIPAFFFIIFAQALSLNVDAYTIKKMLPRLIFATIFIQFSFFIVSIMVDITNVLGNGLGNLLTSQFNPSENFNITSADPSAFLSGITTVGLVVGAVAAVASGFIFTLIIPLLLAVVAVMLTLVFRQLIIILLAVLAPVAFVAWILPNTERLFKLWWNTLIRALMMYPLIVLLFAAGTMGASILVSDTDFIPQEGISIDIVRDVAALAAVIAPLALVPFTFKMAGGGLAAIAGGINNFRARGLKAYKGGAGGPPKPGSFREKAQQLRQRTAAGLGPLSQIPGARVLTREGTGIGRGSRARAITQFRAMTREADKRLEDTGPGSPEVMAEFAAVGHSRAAFRQRVRELENSSDARDQDKGRQLATMQDYVGKREYQAASLQRAAKFGRASEQAFRGTAAGLRGSPAIQTDVVSGAAFASREKGVQHAGWSVNPATGAVVNNPSVIRDAITKMKSSDLAAQSDLRALAPHIYDVLGGMDGAEAAEKLRANLAQAIGPFSDASPANKSVIESWIGQQPQQAQAVRIVNPRRGGGSRPGGTTRP